MSSLKASGLSLIPFSDGPLRRLNAGFLTRLWPFSGPAFGNGLREGFGLRIRFWHCLSPPQCMSNPTQGALLKTFSLTAQARERARGALAWAPLLAQKLASRALRAWPRPKQEERQAQDFGAGCWLKAEQSHGPSVSQAVGRVSESFALVCPCGPQGLA